MRRLVRLALFALVLAGGEAHAQVTTCTNYVPGQVRCETQQPFSPNNYAPVDYSKYLAPVPAPDAPLRALQQQQALAARQRIGQLIAAGRCPEALQEALQTGDLPLAQQVKALCQQ
jgi:hypothetical protein